MSGRTEGGNVERDNLWVASALHRLAPACTLTLLPAEALAHASERGHVLLLPTSHYVFGGAVAVAASFLALIVLPARRAGSAPPHRLLLGSISNAWRLPVSLLSFTVLAVLVAAGFVGSRDPLSNPLPLTVWTLLWVGLALVHGLFGNLWGWINPWYGPYRVASALFDHQPSTRTPITLPQWVDLWPAVFLFAAFAWFELIYPAPDDPARLALAVGLYWCFSFVAMLAFGHDKWSRRGEFLSVFFAFVARFGMIEKHPEADGRSRLSLCLPGAKLASAPSLPLGGTVFLLAALASVSFDGLSKTFFWLGVNGINPLEFPGRTALVATNTMGLALTAGVLISAFLLSVLAGERLAGSRHRFSFSSGLMVWSIVPIALVYHFSHYLTTLLVNVQYALVAISDPFSLGWNLFGTAHLEVGAGIVMGSAAAWVVWNLQAAAIVGGHILAVLAAHRLALRLHETPRAALFSQLPLTILMIAYTVFGLWLLSTPTSG